MAEHVVVKDPNSTINYTLRWGREWLNGDTISTSSWAIDNAPESPISLTIDSNSIGTDSGVSPQLANSNATVIVSGGTAGEVYILRNRIVTAGGLTGDDSIMVRVLHK